MRVGRDSVTRGRLTASSLVHSRGWGELDQVHTTRIPCEGRPEAKSYTEFESILK